jgi:DNA-binding MarR family transcriptional regulator
MAGGAMEAHTPTELAVVLHDLAWLLPRTIGREPDPGQTLPASELEIMRLLVRRPGISVNDAAAELRLAPANVSTALRALEARGLLERRRDPSDGRVVRLHPTAAALAHRTDQEIAWGEALSQALATLPKADARRVLAATASLRALASVLGSQAGGGDGPGRAR